MKMYACGKLVMPHGRKKDVFDALLDCEEETLGSTDCASDDDAKDDSSVDEANGNSTCFSHIADACH